MELDRIELSPRTQGDYQGGYQWQDEVQFHQCDPAFRIRMSTLISHMVTVSGQQYRSYGKTYANLLEQDAAIVLTRATFTIHKMPQCFQGLNISTWLDGTKGPYYYRDFQWESEESQDSPGSKRELLLSCRSDWVLIAPSTRSLLKPDPQDIMLQTKSPISLPPHKRVRLPADFAPKILGEHSVTWSNIDGNGHMNCGNYGDIIWNFLPEHLRSLEPSTFSVEFLKECYLDDRLVVSGAEISPLEYLVVGECGENTSFRARISFHSSTTL